MCGCVVLIAGLDGWHILRRHDHQGARGVPNRDDASFCRDLRICGTALEDFDLRCMGSLSPPFIYAGP